MPPYDRGSPGPGQAALLSSPVACHLQIVKTRRNKPAEVEVSSKASNNTREDFTITVKALSY